MRRAIPIVAMLCGTLLLLMPQVHASVVAANALYVQAIAARSRGESPGVLSELPPASAGPAAAAGIVAGWTLILAGIVLGGASVLTPSPARRSP